MNKTIKTIQELRSSIDWDNWQDDGVHWKTTEVLSSRLEELRDVFCISSDEDYDEFNDTVDMLQTLLASLGQDIPHEQN